MNGGSRGASEIACNASEIMLPGRVTFSISVTCCLYRRDWKMREGSPFLEFWRMASGRDPGLVAGHIRV